MGTFSERVQIGLIQLEPRQSIVKHDQLQQSNKHALLHRKLVLFIFLHKQLPSFELHPAESLHSRPPLGQHIIVIQHAVDPRRVGLVGPEIRVPPFLGLLQLLLHDVYEPCQ